MPPKTVPDARTRRRAIARSALAFLMSVVATGAGPAPFDRFELPSAWSEQFWEDPAAQAFVQLEPKALAALVPTQAGLRFCRCPECGASEVGEPLRWSPASPDTLECRRCKVKVPNEKYPAPDKDKKIPTESVEVLPGLTHSYPYHVLPPEQQRFAEERLYLSARRDYEAREYLAKLALYAAVRSGRPADGQYDPAMARAAAVVLLRFAQVYPTYAVHYDQPGEPKFFQAANLLPPYRTGYRTAKWDWSASLEVPMNLVIAYALLRDGPALSEAGRALDDPDPRRTIEQNLFRAAARFVRNQPEEYDEQALVAVRGVLAVGRLLDDPDLVRYAMARLDQLGRRGFFHDGMWRQGDASSQRRVVSLIDGWIARLLDRDVRSPMLLLAREAGASTWADSRDGLVQQAAWPAPVSPPPPVRPALLGGAGLARLSVGRGADRLDVELRAPGSLSRPQFQRLALRVAVGGRTAIGDLDQLAPEPTGFDLATASHNTVIVDGLNQRETPALAGTPALGGDARFFAADEDFQVAAFDDLRAYPRSTTRYRHVAVVAAGRRHRYAVSFFEVAGGLQHDQVWHAPSGSDARWDASVPLAPASESLLAPGLQYLPNARAEDGRWFVQALGAFRRLNTAMVTRPTRLALNGSGTPAVRLHLLGDLPADLFVAETPDVLQSTVASAGRASLVLRRRSADGGTLNSSFVTLFEPVGDAPTFAKVGRVASSPGTVVLLIETADGPEHLVLNQSPGLRVDVMLADGRSLATDGLIVRATVDGLVLAGGSFAEAGDLRVEQPKRTGKITDVTARAGQGTLGWFEGDISLPEPENLVGRTLLIHHGDGTVRGWTLHHVENLPDGHSRLFVRESPGFRLDSKSNQANYYQFPGDSHPGPHEFAVCILARGSNLKVAGGQKTGRDP